MRFFVLICFLLITVVVTSARHTSTLTERCQQVNPLNRISVRKCNEYKEFAYNKYYIRVLLNRAIERKTSNCVAKAIALILGGFTATKGEFPHMALIGFLGLENTRQWLCGGSLISERFVLSAAHCSIVKNWGPARYVKLGAHNIDDPMNASIDFDIINRIPHPEYRTTSYYNDIVLFELNRNVKFSGAIRPVCLPDKSNVPTQKAIATGWGLQNADDVDGSDVLNKVILDMFSDTQCSNSLVRVSMSNGIDVKTQVCAGSHSNKKKDTCKGDSGGPLQINHESHQCTFTIIGITSVGLPCGMTGDPGVYTRVYSYLDWIEGIVWPNE